MIEFLHGELQFKGDNYLVLQVGGIGYKLFTPTLVIRELPELQTEITLFTYLHVREDELSLYGFLTLEERDLFMILIQVSGIGPKLALTILSHLTCQDLYQAIMLEDLKTLQTVPGVGKKTSGRMVLELKDKFKKHVLPPKVETKTKGEMDLRQEAISALLALGYSFAEAQKAVPQVSEIDKYSAEDLIKLALKNLVKY
ncbi:MAG TPA: Holliday junction branch migration protein RuvA [Clostridia bacterium]|nr:Holliday junction branch migration protein RuvA [Clostridia bacterium]